MCARLSVLFVLLSCACARPPDACERVACGEGHACIMHAGEPSCECAVDGGCLAPIDGSLVRDAGAERDAGGPCSDVVCDRPPGSCFAPHGTCLDGECSYRYVDGAACDDGDACTEDDRCAAGACAGTPALCSAPPASECIDADTLRVYDAVGVCADAACSYVSHERACPNCPACDACAGVVCAAPPNDCFAPIGSCEAGACNYAYADGARCDDGDPCTENDGCLRGACGGSALRCDSPPAPQCVDGYTLRTFGGPGVCALGACEYGASDTRCAS